MLNRFLYLSLINESFINKRQMSSFVIKYRCEACTMTSTLQQGPSTGNAILIGYQEARLKPKQFHGCRAKQKNILRNEQNLKKIK